MSIHERVNKLFEDVLVDRAATREGESVSWSPRVDIYETPREFVVNAEIPGVKQKDLDIKVEGDTLVIRGYRPHLHALSSGQYHMMECTYGVFKRSFPLPASVDAGEITATLRDGVLKIVLPKKAEVMPKQIRID